MVFQMYRLTPKRRSRVRLSLTILIAGAVLAISALQFSSSRAVAQRAVTDEDRFTAYMFQQFRKAMPKVEVRAVAPLTLAIGPGKAAHTLNLDSIYGQCVRNRESCEKEAREFIARMVTFYSSPVPPLDRASLRVVIRPAAYVDQMREFMAEQGGPLVRPLAGGLWLVGVFDLPTTIKMANLRDLESLGLSPEQALAVARQNMLPELRHQIDAALASDRSAITVLADVYGPSLFGFPDLWTPLAEAVHGNLLATLPSSDSLAWGDGAIPGMSAQLSETARQIMAQARRPFSDTVFRWSPTGWTPLPQASSPR